jgi:hypothetical protein
MAITGSASYISTMNEFIAHWAQCDTALAPQFLLVRLPDNSTLLQAQFVELRDTLQARQYFVQSCLTAQQISRGGIELRKAPLLIQFNLFTSLLDGYFRNTDFYAARPYAPSITDGQEVFTRPLGDMLSLWETLNAGPAPAGVTLPLVLGDGTEVGTFASAISGLQLAYAAERRKAQDVTLARAKRNRTEAQAYLTMKSYREAVPGRLTAFPELIETMPRLSPLPGHTPNAVNASAVFVAPGSSKIVYDASTDSMLQSYQLRGNVGEHYSDEDAVVIATHGPNAAREFVTPFGLNQPGAQVAFKVFVILTTDNEAGSAALLVERPADLQLAA